MDGEIERVGSYLPRVAECGIVDLDNLLCLLGSGGWLVERDGSNEPSVADGGIVGLDYLVCPPGVDGW
jgi:hypothetical protein